VRALASLYRAGLVACLLALLPAPALAVIETYDFDNESLQQRFKTLAAELRCPKCQNQNIADSNAPIAADLRKQLHAQLHKGASDEEIVEYMVSRYGEFVLYRPRVNQVTLVLWLAPALLLLLAIVIVVTSFRARAPAAPTPLSEEDKARLDALLETGDRSKDD